jgi:hypothetical protein
VTTPMTARRVWLLASLALVLAFVAGGLAGAAWERGHGAGEHRRHDTRRGSQGVAEAMKHRYGLSDPQTRSIDAILRKRRPRIDSLMAIVGPQLRAAFDSTNAEIRQVLTPGQRAKFDRDQERRRRGMSRFSTPSRDTSSHR